MTPSPRFTSRLSGSCVRLSAILSDSARVLVSFLLLSVCPLSENYHSGFIICVQHQNELSEVFSAHENSISTSSLPMTTPYQPPLVGGDGGNAIRKPVRHMNTRNMKYMLV